MLSFRFAVCLYELLMFLNAFSIRMPLAFCFPLVLSRMLSCLCQSLIESFFACPFWSLVSPFALRHFRCFYSISLPLFCLPTLFPSIFVSFHASHSVLRRPCRNCSGKYSARIETRWGMYGLGPIPGPNLWNLRVAWVVCAGFYAALHAYWGP